MNIISPGWLLSINAVLKDKIPPAGKRLNYEISKKRFLGIFSEKKQNILITKAAKALSKQDSKRKRMRILKICQLARGKENL